MESIESALTQIKRLLIDLADTPYELIPLYRTDEVISIESVLDNGRTMIAQLLASHKKDISRYKQQIESSEQSESSNKVPAIILNPPDGIIVIIVTCLQQLRRGLEIYKYERYQRIINVLGNAQEPEQQLDAIRASLSDSEISLVETLLVDLKNHDLFEDLKPQSSSIDDNKGYL